VKTGGKNREGFYWQIKLAGVGTLPVVELVPGNPKKTVILINDGGRQKEAAAAEKLLAAGNRVLATDLFLFGEAGIPQKDYLFALLIAAVGDRTLGLHAGSLAALARWSNAEHKDEPVTISATGPRSSVIALAAAALEPRAIAGLELHGSFGSLKEVIEQNRKVEEMNELFCFGLLKEFDIKQLAALAAPRPVHLAEPSARVKSELGGLKKWYAVLGKEFEPLR
jgi:hypothetical protein